MKTIIDQDVDQILAKIGNVNLTGKKILITGATGLIGTYLVAALSKYRITNKSTLTIAIIARSKISDYFSNWLTEGDKVIEADISNLQNERTELGTYDIIFHFAGYGQPGRFMLDPLKTIKINTEATDHLFSVLKTGGIFVFASTSEVYSGLKKQSYDENDIGTTTPQHIRACYIEGKRCGEAICQYRKEEGFNVKVVRISLVYGPGTKKGDKRVLNNFIEKALTEKRIEMLDNGAAMRTYCYVSDAVTMILNIAVKGIDHVYNVGGTTRISIRELAELIGKKCNVPVTVPEFGNNMAGAPDDVQLNLERYMKEFGKSRFIGIDDGIQKTIDWQKEIYL